MCQACGFTEHYAVGVSDFQQQLDDRDHTSDARLLDNEPKTTLR